MLPVENLANTSRSPARRPDGPAACRSVGRSSGPRVCRRCPASCAARIEADRNVGAGRAGGGRRRGSRRARDVRLGEQPQRRRRIGRAAAEAGPGRQLLDRVKRPSVRPANALGERTARSTRLSATAAGLPGGRPGTARSRLAARRKRQAVAEAGERHQAFKLMIAVGAAAEDAQRQVDLGGSRRASERPSTAARRRGG